MVLKHTVFMHSHLCQPSEWDSDGGGEEERLSALALAAGIAHGQRDLQPTVMHMGFWFGWGDPIMAL